MNVPNHIAIILDGNGRWAKERGMPRTYGHVKGCANLEIPYRLRFFHRKLETFQGGSGGTDETVPQLP